MLECLSVDRFQILEGFNFHHSTDALGSSFPTQQEKRHFLDAGHLYKRSLTSFFHIPRPSTFKNGPTSGCLHYTIFIRLIFN